MLRVIEGILNCFLFFLYYVIQELFFFYLLNVPLILQNSIKEFWVIIAGGKGGKRGLQSAKVEL